MRFNFFLSLIILWLMCLPVSAEYYQYTDKDGVLRFTDELSEVPSGQRSNITTHPSVTNEDKSAPKNNQMVPDQAIEYQPDEEGYAEGQEDLNENTNEQDKVETQESGEDQSGTKELIVETAEDTEETQGVEEAPVVSEAQPEIEDQAETEEEAVTDEQAEKTPAGDNWRANAREKQKEFDARKMELSKRYKEIEQEKSQLGKPPGEDASPAEKKAYDEKSTQVNEKIVQYQKDYMTLQKEVETFNEQTSKKMKK
jgi:hypothetical protein